MQDSLQTIIETVRNYKGLLRKRPIKEIYEKLVLQNIYVRYFVLPGLGDKLRFTIGTPQQNDKLLAALKGIIV